MDDPDTQDALVLVWLEPPGEPTQLLLPQVTEMTVSRASDEWLVSRVFFRDVMNLGDIRMAPRHDNIQFGKPIPGPRLVESELDGQASIEFLEELRVLLPLGPEGRDRLLAVRVAHAEVAGAGVPVDVVVPR